MAKLDGKVAIVTGASKGIGAAIAEKLAEEGAAVIVNYARSETEAQGVVSRIRTRGGRAVAVKADLSKVLDIRGLFELVASMAACVRAFGKAPHGATLVVVRLVVGRSDLLMLRRGLNWRGCEFP
jgi:NAD(P)-dependent dehydrogenase (short-subunit alcohol dehydrogenase family)